MKQEKSKKKASETSEPSFFFEVHGLEDQDYTNELNLIERENAKAKSDKTFKANLDAKIKKAVSTVYPKGVSVNHEKFGMGTIVDYRNSKLGLVLKIKFKKFGTKEIVNSYLTTKVFTKDDLQKESKTKKKYRQKSNLSLSFQVKKDLKLSILKLVLKNGLNGSQKVLIQMMLN